MPTMTDLKQIFVRSLGIPEDTDFSTLVYRGVTQWDSVAHMRLIAELEEAFDIMLDTDDVIDMSSFEKSGEILRRYGVELDG